MKFFKDADLKEEIEDIDFQVVKVGDSKTITIFMKNNTKATVVNLEFLFPIPPSDLAILECPKTLRPDEVGKLVLKWTPNVKIKEALEVPLRISFDEIYYASRKIK